VKLYHNTTVGLGSGKEDGLSLAGRIAVFQALLLHCFHRRTLIAVRVGLPGGRLGIVAMSEKSMTAKKPGKEDAPEAKKANAPKERSVEELQEYLEEFRTKLLDDVS
jgi:hypothetical protein